MKFLWTDIKRIFTEPAFLLSLAFGLILLIGPMGYWVFIIEYGRLYERSQSIALPFVAPLLAAMPYSVMIMRERETRFGSLMMIKLSKSSYRFKRFFTCGLSGAAALFIPQLVLFVICIFLDVIDDYPAALLGLVLPVTFGFGWASIAYGLTFVNRQSYIPLVMPQVLYLLCIYAFPHLKLERFYPPLDISPAVYGGEITPDRFVIPAALAALGLLLTAFGKGAERK